MSKCRHPQSAVKIDMNLVNRREKLDAIEGLATMFGHHVGAGYSADALVALTEIAHRGVAVVTSDMEATVSTFGTDAQRRFGHSLEDARNALERLGRELHALEAAYDRENEGARQRA